MKNENYHYNGILFNEELWYINTSPKNSILNIELSGMTFPDTGYRVTRPDNYDMFVIEYVMSGKGHIRCNGHKHTVHKGQTYIIRNYTVHEYWADENEPYKKVFINVSGSFITHLMETFNLVEPLTVRDVDLAVYFYKIKDILEDEHDIEALSHVLLEMFFRISESSQQQPQKDLPLADKIRKELDKSTTVNVSAKEIAKIFNITPVYANRVYKAKYGQTIKQYVSEIALKKAAYWLKNSDFSVGEISDMLGYCNDNYFSGLFKKAYGISPKQYQMKHSQKERCNYPVSEKDGNNK